MKRIPLDRILIENWHAPDLTSRAMWRGWDATNVPENIVYVARELAKCMHVEEEELLIHAKENTERIFRIEHRDGQVGTEGFTGL